jgi:beta-N-acetylhexosaminidase
MDARALDTERRLSPETTIPMPSELRDRIGQMVMVGFRGMTALEAQPTIRNIAAGSVGAVVVYDVDAQTGGTRNIRSRDQLRELVGALKAANEIPVLVTIDNEGGFYHRLKEQYGFGPVTPAAELGERNDLAFTREAAALIAAQLVDMGIDMNLAPVVDLHNPANLTVSARRRSFSSDPALVAAHAAEFIRAHHALGVLTCAKHYPGLRGALGPLVTGVGEAVDSWSDDELVPYRALVGEGLLDAVLASRFIHAELDAELPCCLSPRVIDGLLRRELGFDGVVISDPIEMLSIWDVFGFERGTIMAVNAGVDLLLFCNVSQVLPYSDERGPEAVQVILDAVARGEIAESRVNDACRRVLTLKSRRGVRR